MTVEGDIIANAFNMFSITWAVALDVSKGFERVEHAYLLHKHKPSGNSGKVFKLVLSFLDYRRLCVVTDGMFKEEWPINVGIPQSIGIVTLFLS